MCDKDNERKGWSVLARELASVAGWQWCKIVKWILVLGLARKRVGEGGGGFVCA